MEGWISIHRCLMSHYLWKAEKITKGMAWIELLLLANHKEGKIRVRGNLVTIKRGQVGWSERSLADRWKWSRGKVKRFLKELEKEGNIVPQKNNVTTVITITNYEEYQKNGPQTVPQTGHRQYHNNNVKNENNKYSESFEKFWEIYPPRNGKKLEKKQAFIAFKKIAEKDVDNLMRNTLNYASSDILKKDAKRFLKDDYWKEWETPTETQEQANRWQ